VAKNVFEMAIARGAESAPLYYSLGRVFQLQGELTDAESSFRKAILLDSTFVQAYVNLGGVLFQLDHFEDAREIWLRALVLEPTHKVLMENLEALEQRFNP